ncbi:MAG: hypothetical protein ACJ8JD_12560 [Chthoniobacterales bacterium]
MSFTTKPHEEEYANEAAGAEERGEFVCPENRGDRHARKQDERGLKLNQSAAADCGIDEACRDREETEGEQVRQHARFSSLRALHAASNARGEVSSPDERA